MLGKNRWIFSQFWSYFIKLTSLQASHFQCICIDPFHEGSNLSEDVIHLVLNRTEILVLNRRGRLLLTLAQLPAPPRLTMPANTPPTMSAPPLSPWYLSFQKFCIDFASSKSFCSQFSTGSVYHPPLTTVPNTFENIAYMTGALLIGTSTEHANCEVETIFLHVWLALTFINYCQLKQTD